MNDSDIFYNRIRYLTSLKSGIVYVISYNYAKIKVDSYNSKTMTFYVTTLIKSARNKDKHNYYCNIFLEKDSHELLNK